MLNSCTNTVENLFKNSLLLNSFCFVEFTTEDIFYFINMFFSSLNNYLFTLKNVLLTDLISILYTLSTYILITTIKINNLLLLIKVGKEDK